MKAEPTLLSSRLPRFPFGLTSLAIPLFAAFFLGAWVLASSARAQGGSAATPTVHLVDVDVSAKELRARGEDRAQVTVPVEVLGVPDATWIRLVLHYDGGHLQYRGIDIEESARASGWKFSSTEGFREVAEGLLAGSLLRDGSEPVAERFSLASIRFDVRLDPKSEIADRPFQSHAVELVGGRDSEGTTIGFLPADGAESSVTPVSTQLESSRIFVHESSWVEVGSGEMTRRGQVFELPLYLTVLDPAEIVWVGIDYDELILREVRVARPLVANDIATDFGDESGSFGFPIRFSGAPRPHFRTRVADLVFEYVPGGDEGPAGAIVVVPSLGQAAHDGGAQLFAASSIPGAVTFVEPRFVRGNVDSSTAHRADARPDIDDAIRMLRALYLPGEPRLPCLEAADVNDSGRVDVTDAIHLLNYLFRGSSPPSPPYPALGLDPEDSPRHLGCESPLPWFAPVPPER